MKSLKIRLMMTAAAMIIVANFAGAQELKDMVLPAPKTEGGKPLMQALKERQTTRAYDTKKKLPLQVVSDLLWAGFGINRQDSGKRTAPSTMNWQEMDIYVVLEEGTFVYDPKANSLKAVASGDLRKLTGSQEFVATAPLNLVYVADLNKIKNVPVEEQLVYSFADVGFISQNIYLFCASEGLGTVVRGMIADKKALGEALKLGADKKIILAQSVGYPVEGK